MLVFSGLFFFAKNKSTINVEVKNDSEYEPTKPIEAPFEMPAIEIPKFSKNICNIKNYGAVGDGKFINTQLIKNAIEDCSQKGGGKIIFPEGKWLTGPIHLKSGIDLNLEKNSEIIFTTNLDDYLPVVFSKFQTMEYYNFSPPIYGKDLENIGITGSGKIVGNGDFWEEWARTDNSEKQREKLFEMSRKGIPAEKRVWGTKNSGLRPSFIQFVNCKNIFIEGLTIENGPMWTIHPIYSENMIVRKVNINTHSINTDGIAIDSSRNILIEDSIFSTGDDAIAIKSGLEEEGLRTARPSENIVVRNSKFINGHGAIAFGSEMSGGIRNVLIEKSVFNGTDSGFRIKSTSSRGGFIENIWTKNIEMEKIRDDAIIFDLEYKSSLSSEILRKPTFSNMHFENIKGKDMDKALDTIGLENGKTENIYFKNNNFESANGSDLKYAKDFSFENFYLKINSSRPALQVRNSQDIKFINFECGKTGNICLNIEGKKTLNIDLSESGIQKNSVSIEDKIRNHVKIK